MLVSAAAAAAAASGTVLRGNVPQSTAQCDIRRSKSVGSRDCRPKIYLGSRGYFPFSCRLNDVH